MIDPSGHSVAVDRAQIKRYLDLIYPPELGWRGMISASHSLPDGTGMPSGRWTRDGAMDGLAELAESAVRRGAPGTYLRCSTVRADLRQGARGGAGDSVELPGLWADIDIAGPGHKHDPGKHGTRPLPADVDQALGIITASGLPWPSAVVHSGGGLYAWWLTERPIDLDATPGARDYWSTVSAAWQARLAAGAESMGLHYGTGVGNLDRVLGLVGTLNAKIPGQPRMRVLTELGDGRRREAYELERAAMSGRDATPVVTGKPGAAGDGRVEGPIPASSVHVAGHVSPLDDFESRHSWAEILVPKGWALVKGDAVAGGYCEWRRPGASHPLSASTGKDPQRDRLWCFSDAAGLPVNEPLTKGYVYAALWHGGDLRTAAGAVRELGYGTLARQRPVAVGAARGPQVASGNPGTAPVARHLELVPASGMGGPRASRWLWAEAGAHWLPLGGLCLLGGREGLGKTTWTYRLIAQLTAGTLPGDLLGQPRAAVIAASEDSWEHTIIPRLMAAGADLDLVYRIDAVEPDRRTGVSLPDDLAALGVLLAEHPQIGMLVLDPIITVLSAKLDSHKDHEVRKALEPISALAHGTGVTVVGLIHDNKSSGTDLSTRLMGSRAFVAVARAALVCTEERGEPDESATDALGADPVQIERSGEPLPASAAGPPRVFVLGQVKNNLEAKVAWSIRYRIGAVSVGRDVELDKDIRGSHIVRIGRQTSGVEEIVREQERGGSDRTQVRRAAGQAVIDLLTAEGETQSLVVKTRLGEQGHAPATVERAMRDLGSKITVARKGRNTYWSVTGHNPPSNISDLEDVDDVLMHVMPDAGQGSNSRLAEGTGTDSPQSPHESALPARDVSRCECPCAASLPAGQHTPWCSVGRVTA